MDLKLLIVWVGALQIMLDKGQELVENPHPVIDLCLFKRRNFWTGTLALSPGYVVFFGKVVILPLWLSPIVVQGAAMAFFFVPLVSLLRSRLSNFARITAGSPHTQQCLGILQGRALSLPQASAAIDQCVEMETPLLAANDLLWLASLLFPALIAVIWLTRRAIGTLAPEAGDGAH